MTLTGETKEVGEPCPCANLSTINPTWNDQGANAGVRPAANRLSHGPALA
jgi:hypothetical protein